MTNAIQATSAPSQIAIESGETQSEEEFVWPEYTPSPAHRNFLERLKRARIERGLSIPDMAEEVGLGLRLAHEFEHGVTPLPFEWLEVWCQALGVPFADYLAIYLADEREWAEQREAREREDAREEAEREVRECEADAIEADASEEKSPALSPPPREFGFLNFLRAAVAHIVRKLLSLFSTR